MRINNINSQPVKIGEETIETDNYFCYLGTVITTNGESAENIRYRFIKGRSLEKIQRLNHIFRNTKIRLFTDCIATVILCDCEL